LKPVRHTRRHVGRIIHRHKHCDVCANEFGTRLNCCSSSRLQHFSHSIGATAFRLPCIAHVAGGASLKILVVRVSRTGRAFSSEPSICSHRVPALKEKTARPDWIQARRPTGNRVVVVHICANFCPVVLGFFGSDALKKECLQIPVFSSS
jgi:hypothetical protein